MSGIVIKGLNNEDYSIAEALKHLAVLVDLYEELVDNEDERLNQHACKLFNDEIQHFETQVSIHFNSELNELNEIYKSFMNFEMTNEQYRDTLHNKIGFDIYNENTDEQKSTTSPALLWYASVCK